MKTKKTLISVFAIIALVAVLVVSCVACQTIKDGADKAKDKVNELVDKAKDKVNNLELAVENNPRLSLAMADDNNSKTLTATVTSDVIEDKRVSWNVAFAEETSENVNDYITLTVSEDTTTVTLKANPFNKVIIITAASVVYPEIKATCTCNYIARQRDVVDLRSNNGSLVDTLNTSSVYDKIKPLYCGDLRSLKAVFHQGGACFYVPTEAKAKTLYTIDCETFNMTWSVKPSDGLFSELQKQGLAKTSNDFVNLTVTKDGTTHYLAFGYVFNKMCNVDILPFNGGDQAAIYENIKKFNTAVMGNNTECDFYLSVDIDSSTIGRTSHLFKLKIDRDKIPANILMSISLSNSDLTF